jgi:predicted O-methyltransferase YrrM
MTTPGQEHLRQLQAMDYSHLPLSPETEASMARVREAAESICGEDWNYQSNALRREVVYVFERVVEYLAGRFERVDYLEIGSAHGVSLSIIACLLENAGVRGRLVSVDPYVPYTAGARGIWGGGVQIQTNEAMASKARTLYDNLGLAVCHHKTTSLDYLSGRDCSVFNLIYIDGLHEGLTPMRDLTFSLEILRPGGVIMLDEPHWPDVAPLVELCERNLQPIAGCWKTVAYGVPR